MYFKKLELVGFKSFLEKTTLHFEPGITAIVGPNGTGKSNIFDAIRWVLGEQSIKSMRGSSMQDVIFNGTDSKEPVGMADVTLIFDNRKRFFNLDHPEVAVTRRIFRTGESEYMLNKTSVRLKDILDLFMGTGIGAESYSLVEQGKIDLILSVKPEERRLVFDEVSGITKYKTQKKEALRKLEETDQNLLRINDIIAEVKRQIGSLERQANKARKYKEIFEELKSRDIDLASLQMNKVNQEKDQIIGQLNQLQTEEEELLNLVKEQESNISQSQQELGGLEANIRQIKDEILNLDNLVVRNKQHITFNQEKIKELETDEIDFVAQVGEVKNRLAIDEEKLNNLKQEYNGIKDTIKNKKAHLKEKEAQLNGLNSSTKLSLENIAETKRVILELVSKIAHLKNELTDFNSKQQIHLARKKRLELEKAKVIEEKSIAQDNLKNLIQELKNLNKIFADLNRKISQNEDELAKEKIELDKINQDIERLEKQRLALASHKDFIEKLKTEYEDIGESLNAVVYLDKLPMEKPSGLVIKIRQLQETELKISGEAKPIDLDTQKLIEKLAALDKNLGSLNNEKTAKENRIEELNKIIRALQEELRSLDITLANKKSIFEAASVQFNKIKEEEEIIVLELSDVEKELILLDEKSKNLQDSLNDLEKEHWQKEEFIVQEQNTIAANSNLKEKVLVEITQAKTEIEGLLKRIDSDEATLKILEGTYQQDKDSFLNIERQIQESKNKKESLSQEIDELEDKISETLKLIEKQKNLLSENENTYQKISQGSNQIINKIEADRRKLDTLKDKLYELQMQNKDVDFKILGLKERILQAYKIEIDVLSIPKITDEDLLAQEIQKLKEKLDSLGTVNLVAIEEYDDLKKRYDFLTQQQNDLLKAKDSLHDAILKINRTAKKMFQETFALIREEFRNYFRLLFGGGEAQVFLIDEQNPLESGIEIICRPPGKKLQNVLLLSGGEKSLSAIAMIFAIFKVKPSPFCVLDEIDAALDEANIDRFNRLLREFAKESQFLVITHNKRTIANADIMYGITMEESGVSKIISVKFAKETEVAVGMTEST